MQSRPWGIILAGGDGTRLKAVSRIISGDCRPKQFCVLFGNTSLLARTRDRLSPSIEPNRMLFAVVRGHEQYYRPELAGVDQTRIVVQPANRGTTAAMIYSLLRLTRLEEDPIVAFFPADHHFIDEKRFAGAVNRAFEVVYEHPELLVLLGASAETAEVEYGWIEQGRHLDGDRRGPFPVFRVNRFWEKPSAPTAEALLYRGCLWNTFVIAGRARAFLEILKSALPHSLDSFQPVVNPHSNEEEKERAAALYEGLPSGDFSRDVLTQRPERLAVLQMDNTGWCDLGTPEGLVAALRKTASAAVGCASSVGSPETLPSSTSPALMSHSAFSSWLDAYRHQLEEVRRQSNAKGTTAEQTH
jgi:mannose-1-phosphate guanylyltransferase